MSITCALMSRRPSSNTANSPTGPAPMMTASASIGAPVDPFMGWPPIAPSADIWDLPSLRADGGSPPTRLLPLAGCCRHIVLDRAILIPSVGKHLLHILHR